MNMTTHVSILPVGWHLAGPGQTGRRLVAAGDLRTGKVPLVLADAAEIELTLSLRWSNGDAGTEAVAD